MNIFGINCCYDKRGYLGVKFFIIVRFGVVRLWCFIVYVCKRVRVDKGRYDGFVFMCCCYSGFKVCCGIVRKCVLYFMYFVFYIINGLVGFCMCMLL